MRKSGRDRRAVSRDCSQSKIVREYNAKRQPGGALSTGEGPQARNVCISLHVFSNLHQSHNTARQKSDAWDEKMVAYGKDIDSASSLLIWRELVTSSFSVALSTMEVEILAVK